MIDVTLPDGSHRKLKKDSTVNDLAQDILTTLSPIEALAATLEYTFKKTFAESHYRAIKTDSLDHHNSQPFKKNRFSKKRSNNRFNTKKRYYK